MPQYRVILKGDFELTVEANNYKDLYDKLKEGHLENNIEELWARMTVRVGGEDNG